MKQFNDQNHKLFKGSVINFVIGIFIAILLLIPTSMIEDLVRERKANKQKVKLEIGNNWGEEQSLVGPFIEVPYTYYENKVQRSKAADKVILENVNTEKTTKIVFTPEDLKIDGDVKSKTKKRGIYKYVVYNSDLKINGSFSNLKYEDLILNNKKIDSSGIKWDEAKFIFYISDLTGLNNNISLNWDGNKTDLQPLIDDFTIKNPQNNSYYDGIYAGIDLNRLNKNNFSINVKIKGSEQLNFIPQGTHSEISLNSDWHSPKFSGSFLPDNSEVTDNGFSASWNINRLNRPTKQSWVVNGTRDFSKYSFGVELIEPVDKYLKTMRATKYAILFILLSFISMFLIEVFTGRDNNLLQYLLTGLALVLFYSILLSLTEIMSFNIAYLISSVSIISLVSFYSRLIFKKAKYTLILFSLWAALYSFLFFILQLEDHALLAGNIGLFIILAVIMYVTRKLNISFPGKTGKREVIVDKGDNL